MGIIDIDKLKEIWQEEKTEHTPTVFVQILPYPY